MPARYIWIQNKRYYLYEKYGSWKEAMKVAKRFKKKNNCKYFILPVEKQGILDIMSEIVYYLYLDRAMRLW